MKNGRRKGDAAKAAAALALARVVVVVWGWICVREDPPPPSGVGGLGDLSGPWRRLGQHRQGAASHPTALSPPHPTPRAGRIA